MKRYSSFSLDELLNMTPRELGLVCESLNEILREENGAGD